MLRIANRTAMGTIALALAACSLLISSAAGVSPGSNNQPNAEPSLAQAAQRSGRVLTKVVRVGRGFTVPPHSLATNQLVRCPAGTKLVGGGTSLIGEPSSPPTAPIVYTNGPVGRILFGEEQSWASEVANGSDETFTYRQFALCVKSKLIHDDED